tara:strand:+ start:14 stop:430 length:417 start_codon:yes stop_codon:yes gene_type:complete
MKTREQARADLLKMESFIKHWVSKRNISIETHQTFELEKIEEITQILIKADVYDQIQEIDKQRLEYDTRLRTALKKLDSDLRAVSVAYEELREEIQSLPTDKDVKKENMKKLSEIMLLADPKTKKFMDRVMKERDEKK